MSSFHEHPHDYLEKSRSLMPRYDELEDASVAAIPFSPERVLELGFGTAETTRRVWERFPETRITGIDASPEMVFKARELGWEEMRLGRMEDPLPDGPWDLVIAVLVVHHLPSDAKRDLFRRIREQSRSLVIGDVVRADPQLTPVPAEFELEPAATLADWTGGEVVWEADDFAVIRAVYA